MSAQPKGMDQSKADACDRIFFSPDGRFAYNSLMERAIYRIIDANFNRGLSGGIVLAIRDGIPNFELVGMAKSVSASNDYFLQPKQTVEEYSYDPKIPYRGDSYVRLQSIINYGVTHVISIETIQEFIQNSEDILDDKGYYFYDLFR